MRLVSGALKVALAGLAIVLLAISVTALPQALEAARGEGTRGRFTAEREECSGRGCAYYGTWRADPPEDRVVTNALMDEWPADRPLGSSVPALYLGESDPAVVYPAEDSLAWLYILAIAGFAVVTLVGAITGFLENRRQARRRYGYEPRRVRHPLDP